ncbi:MAG: hypothetical protein U0Q11_21780 [Vicinamibacterales bacterium]
MTIHHDRHHATYVTNLNTARAVHRSEVAQRIEDLVRSIDTLPERGPHSRPQPGQRPPGSPGSGPA